MWQGTLDFMLIYTYNFSVFYWDRCGKLATVAVHVSCTKGAYLLVVARGKMPALLQNWDMPQEEETEDDNPMRLSAYDVDQNIVSSC